MVCRIPTVHCTFWIFLIFSPWKLQYIVYPILDNSKLLEKIVNTSSTSPALPDAKFWGRSWPFLAQVEPEVPVSTIPPALTVHWGWMRCKVVGLEIYTVDTPWGEWFMITHNEYLRGSWLRHSVAGFWWILGVLPCKPSTWGCGLTLRGQLCLFSRRFA